MFKKAVRINWVQDIIAIFLSIILRLIRTFSSWRTINPEIIKRFESKNKPLIILMWHNQIIGIPYSWNINRKLFNIVSDHPDSKLSEKIQKKFGFESLVRSSKKPSAIYRKLIKIGENNQCIFITPDGPHGPRYQVNSNIYNLAKKIEADVIFLSFKTNRKIKLNTWDKLRIPLPFSKGYFYWGRKINYKDYNESNFNEEIKKNLNNGIKIINEYLYL